MGGPAEGELLKHVNRAVAVAAFAVAVLYLAGPASAAEQTKTFRYPVTVKGYQVRQAMTLADHPHIDGFITRMSANIVDKDGTPVPIQRLMLHHIVFSQLSNQLKAQCPQFTGFDASQKLPGYAHPFYGAGEERNKLVLPNGYGLPMKKSDTWINTWML